MDSVLKLTRLVIVLTFLWTAAEYMLADATYKKYVDFVYGLVLITLLVNTVFNVRLPDFSVGADQSPTSQIGGNEYLRQLYEQTAENTLRDKFGDKTIDVTLGNDYKVLSFTCKDESTRARIKEYLYGE